VNAVRSAVHRYAPAPPVAVGKRTRPGRTITTARRWLCADPRDGNSGPATTTAALHIDGAAFEVGTAHAG
jgi:hypothetical protein